MGCVVLADAGHVLVGAEVDDAAIELAPEVLFDPPRILDVLVLLLHDRSQIVDILVGGGKDELGPALHIHPLQAEGLLLHLGRGQGLGGLLSNLEAPWGDVNEHHGWRALLGRRLGNLEHVWGGGRKIWSMQKWLVASMAMSDLPASSGTPGHRGPIHVNDKRLRP